MNNRNCKPSLRLVDGGPSPWSIKGIFKAATAPAAPAETVSQKYARQDAERAAKAAAAAPAAPAPVQPAAGISGYVGNTALQAREKAAGLEHGGELAPAHARGLGGEVEGPKGVDKVNSRYTDGEFVASVPMMKKVPGLRDYLNDLRTEVLAEQGMTPEEADAKAVGGKTLRASAGGGWYDNLLKRPETQNGQVVSGNAAQRAGVATGGSVDSGTTGNQRGLLRTLTDQAFPATSTILRGRGEDAAYEASKGNWSGAAMHGIRGGIEGAGALGLDVARPVLRALEPVGRGITNTAYSVATGDSAPLVAAPTAPNTPAALPSLRTPAPTYSGPMGPQINPDAPSLRGRPGADVAGAPGVSKFVENGRTLYSNVAGDNAAMLDKRQVGIVPGMSQDLINRTLTNPDGSRWGANDNAIMAANLRDGIDPYRGTSRQKGEDEAAQLKGMRELAFSKPGTPGRRSAMKMFAEQQQQQTLRQGQDLKYKGDTYNADMTAATAQLKARADAAKDERDFGLRKETHDQTFGAKAQEHARKEFHIYKDGKLDSEASDQAYDAVRQIFPGIGSSNEAEREAAMPRAKAMAKIFNRARTQDKVGWDAMKFWEAKRPVLNGMPDVTGTTGANVEQVGPFAGLVTLNASNGDTLLRQKDGRTLNLGVLDSLERSLLDDAQKKGWGN